MEKRFKWLSMPYILWMLLFILFPIIIVIRYSVTREVMGDDILTLEYYRRFFQSRYFVVLLQSIQLAFVCTVICLVIGYPMAYFIAEFPEKRRNTMMLLIILPMWMNFLLRTFAWISILSRHGLINQILLFLGLDPVKMLYTRGAILLGMVYNFLPFMILPIHTVLIKIENSFVEAAQDLGANRWQSFWKIEFPLSISGVITGIMMVFIPAISTFEISALLGGNKYNLIGNIVEYQFKTAGNWHYGSAIAVVLMTLIVLALYITNKYEE
ncbi:MAG: ABC transporter permease [Tissierellia bacterium]|nr:ABC transporter permease [Tissierellia bacterium]